MDYFDDEYGVSVPDFPNYEITNYGRVVNTRFGREMVQSVVTGGDLTVGMVRNGHQYRRSVKKLVARSFVPGESGICNTPMLLDGDRRNLHVSNIVWRPRWYIWEYANQLVHQLDWYFVGPIYDETNDVMYDSYWDAAIACGLLCKDIMNSVYAGTEVFPTGQRFLYISTQEKLGL